MTILEIKEILGARVLSGEEWLDKEVHTACGSDMMSDVLAFVNKLKKNGKEAILKFSKWTLTNDLVGDTVVGDASFKEYIESRYKAAK